MNQTRPGICVAAITTICLGLHAIALAQPIDVDVLLTGAELHVGDGQRIDRGDVAIRDDRIIGVGQIDVGRVKLTIDCTGLILSPGFIDLHNHSDDDILLDSRRSAMNYIMQGCTTLVTGNCGSGPIDVAKYYKTIDRLGAGTNIAHLLPQGTLRKRVVGADRRLATKGELQEMRTLARQAMKDGAWGMSTGLIYVPSSYANTEELVAIAEVVGQHDGFYASHIRNEGTGLLDAVHEALEIGQRAALPVHISHFKSSGKDSWGLVRTAVEVIKSRRAEGQSVTADQYPYTASSTSLQATLLPAWARAGGRSEMLKRLQPEHETSQRALDAVREKLRITDDGHRIQIASFSRCPEWSGRRLDDIAREEGIGTLELFLQIEKAGGASVVNHSINEQDVRYVMQQPWVATASDGAAKTPGYKMPHPRSYGTFPRKIGHYSIREGILSLEQAVRSSTGLPAKILGMDDRGLLKPGHFADLVVFSREKIIDTATFEDPHRYNEGIEHVFVNGQLVVYRGRATGVLAGRALRKH